MAPWDCPKQRPRSRDVLPKTPWMSTHSAHMTLGLYAPTCGRFPVTWKYWLHREAKVGGPIESGRTEGLVSGQALTQACPYGWISRTALRGPAGIAGVARQPMLSFQYPYAVSEWQMSVEVTNDEGQDNLTQVKARLHSQPLGVGTVAHQVMISRAGMAPGTMCVSLAVVP